MNLEEMREETMSYKRESKAIPTFEGENAYWWLIKAEQYFQALKISEKEKLSWALLAMRGSALNWWYYWKRNNPNAKW